MTNIKVEYIRKIQEQAKEDKMNVIFRENQELIGQINKYIENCAKENKNNFSYDINTKKLSNIWVIEDYYKLAGFSVNISFDMFDIAILTVKW